MQFIYTGEATFPEDIDPWNKLYELQSNDLWSYILSLLSRVPPAQLGC